MAKKNKPSNKFLNGIIKIFAVIIFILGIFTLFSGELNQEDNSNKIIFSIVAIGLPLFYLWPDIKRLFRK